MIRPAGVADLAALMEIENACFDRPYSAESVLGDLKGDKVKTFVFQDGDNILGFISVYVFLDEANLQQIAVLESHRKKGYAKALILNAIDYLKQNKIKKFYLEVNETNKIAISLYEKLGFEKVITRKNYYGSNSAMVYEMLL